MCIYNKCHLCFVFIINDIISNTQSRYGNASTCSYGSNKVDVIENR